MNDRSVSSDAELIAATLGGQQQAFGELVVRYQARLFNSVFRVVHCEAMTADVVQEAFVLAWRKLDRFAGRSSFYTWLFQIARNHALSKLRSRRPAISIDDREHNSNAVQLPGRELSPSAALEQNEDRMMLEQALDRLSEEHRTILVLREMEEMDYDQIAEALDLPVGTVRSRLFRARVQLREELTRAIGVDQ